ncbi:MAG: polysaccharide deacetylase family protein [Bacteroidetes bacterium]|nr:polysaccharide deacetylase family protein [Bacteroidota bacterium]
MLQKKVACLIHIFIFLVFSIPVYSQTIVSPYEVGTWMGFRDAAVSYTFDDNCTNQLKVAVPMFDSCGFKLTLFTVTNWSPNWSGLSNAVANGHEVGNHTVSHADFRDITDEQEELEISTASNLINTNITGPKCITLAYPYCAPGNDSICALYFVAARGCQQFVEGSTPVDFMCVSSIICGSSGSVETAGDFENNLNYALTFKGWIVYLIHGIDDDGGYSPLSSGVLRASVQHLYEQKEKVWVTSFGNAARYIRERNCLSVTETSSQDSTIILQVTDTLDNDIYNVPVTIRRPLPNDWISATADQNGMPLDVVTSDIDTLRYMMFDAVPDGGDVVIRKSNITGAMDEQSAVNPDRYRLYQNYPNPFNPKTVISYKLTVNSKIVLKIYDMLGREAAVLVNGNQSAGEHAVEWNARNYPSGVYLYRLQVYPVGQEWHAQNGAVKGYFETKKLVLIK